MRSVVLFCRHRALLNRRVVAVVPVTTFGFRQTSCVVEGSVFAGHWINRQLLVACAFIKNRILYRVLLFVTFSASNGSWKKVALVVFASKRF